MAAFGLQALEAPGALTALTALAAIGAAWLVAQLAGLLYGVWAMFLRPARDLRRSYGSWAIVTGATDGIGKAMACELARARVNVVLVSRNAEKLAVTEKELQSKFGVETKAVAVDLAGAGAATEAGFAQVQALAQSLEVGILVNNAGVSYPFAQFVHEVDEELVAAIVNVNIVAATRLTRIVIPPMLERRRGAIVNIGSGAATVIPSDPLYAVYAASKAYIDQFSKTLSVEYAGRGIHVQCQAPLYVTTKLAKIRRPTLTCPTPAAYARAALRWVGRDARCTPFWAHGVLWALLSRVPAQLLDAVRLSQNLAIRRRGLAKAAKAGKEA